MTTKLQLIGMARVAAEAHGLDPALFQALCHHESGNWNQWACRYEAEFYQRYVAAQKLSATEKHMRATSFGLCQIMGQVAREFGFAGDYLTELLDPVTNLEYGCRKLASCMDRANADVRQALLFYNGSGNPDYPNLVLRHYSTYSDTGKTL